MALALAIAFPLSGCDSTGIDGPMTPCTSGCGGGGNGGGGNGGGSADSLIVPVNPMQTYLLVESGFTALNAQAVSLAGLGVAPGDSVCFRAVGDYVIGGGVLASQNDQPLGLGVFSATPRLDPIDQRNRVLDAVEAGEDIVSPATVATGSPTDIDQDFDATNACLTVPAGARYLFLSVWDNYFADNTEVDGQTFGVSVRRN